MKKTRDVSGIKSQTKHFAGLIEKLHLCLQRFTLTFKFAQKLKVLNIFSKLDELKARVNP